MYPTRNHCKPKFFCPPIHRLSPNLRKYSDAHSAMCFWGQLPDREGVTCWMSPRDHGSANQHGGPPICPVTLRVSRGAHKSRESRRIWRIFSVRSTHALFPHPFHPFLQPINPFCSRLSGFSVLVQQLITAGSHKLAVRLGLMRSSRHVPRYLPTTFLEIRQLISLHFIAAF